MNILRVDKKWKAIVFHILAWIIVLSLPYLLSQRFENSQRDPESTHFIVLNMLTGILWAGLFYLNANYLTPRFIYTKKYLQFSIITLSAFCVIMIIHLLQFVVLIREHPISITKSVAFNSPAFLLAIAIKPTLQIVVSMFLLPLPTGLNTIRNKNESMGNPCRNIYWLNPIRQKKA